MNLFSLNVTSMEIEKERVSSSQDEHNLGGGAWLLKNEQGQTRGERGSKLGNLERMYFLNDSFL